MRRITLFGACILSLVLVGCTGGAAGDPSDDIGDLYVLTHSPGNGDELDLEDSLDGYNHLNNPTLRNPGAVTLQFTNSVLPSSVINPDPTDPQGTINVRFFYFDTNQGSFDPTKPKVVGVNPPGGNVIVPAQTVLTFTNFANDTLIIRPTGISPTTPLPAGQYSVTVELGVKGADGQNLRGREYFFYFRAGKDTLPPVVVQTKPAAGEQNVDPTSEIRITMSETIRASSVNNSTILVSYQPTGFATPITIPGAWYTDGGNAPGNNFPAQQLDINGNPGFSGVSPRNGADLVFRPNLDAFPTNMIAEDPNDPFCTLISDPPKKGNKGLPLGAAVTVRFVTTGVGVVDTAGNPVPATSPNTTFTFETKRAPDAIFAPNTNDAVFYGDTQGVGVIQVNPARTPYIVGPNPARANNSVVTTVGAAPKVVRVPVQDLVTMVTDTRVYSAFYTFICGGRNSPSLFFTTVYALSSSAGGGEVTVIDSFNMVPLGRFGTPSPGGVAVTANGVTAGSARAAISNFSANTVTIFDVADVRFYTGSTLYGTQAGLAGAVGSGSAKLVLNEEDFEQVFPHQKGDLSSPPGPQVIGTINVGISPSSVDITGLPNSLGVYSPPFCYSPVLSSNTIVAVLNAGENTVDFSELTNLSQSAAIEPSLRGVSVSSQPVDIEWAQAFSFTTGSYYACITGIGGTVELFASGFIANQPSVRPESSSNFSPNKIINNIGGLEQPTALQWITSGNGVFLQSTPYTGTWLVAETGQNRLWQLALTQQAPSNLFEVVNKNHPAGLGPIDITGDPAQAFAINPCTPTFTTYYVANAGEGTVRTADYGGGVIGQQIAVPGVLKVVSWWSR
jgi:hypothetical protein